MKCPNCNEEMVDILYGLPSPEAFEKKEKKQLYFGGCDVYIDVEQPCYHCYNCNRNYYKDLINSDDLNNSDDDLNADIPSFLNKN